MYNHTLSPDNAALFEAMLISLTSPLTRMVDKHLIKCDVCGHEFTATPISKAANYKKHGAGGCPKCTAANRSAALTGKKSTKPFQVFWDQLSSRLQGTPVDITAVKQSYEITRSQKVRVEWKCLTDATHSTWITTIASAVEGHGCPECGKAKSALSRQLMGKSYRLTAELGKELKSPILLGPNKLPYIELQDRRVSIVSLDDVAESKFGKYKLRDTADIVFFEDEWKTNKQLLVKKMDHILGVSTVRSIYARQCVVRSISNQDTRELLNAAHVQGFVTAQYCYGLFFNDELLAVQTFSAPRVLMSQGAEPNTYELIRYATREDVRVVGGASKLLKAFVVEHSPKLIFSLSDNRWSEGNLYQRLGFVKKAINPPDYFYIVDGVRKHRWGFRKDKLRDNPSVNWDATRTEYDMVLNDLHIDRVWGKGTTRWDLVLQPVA
jgi:hypothetical protein